MEQQQEILDRTRRIETRLTKIGNAMGVDVGGGKPFWCNKRRCVVLPSPGCAITEVVRVVPEDLKHLGVDVYVGDDCLCRVRVSTG